MNEFKEIHTFLILLRPSSLAEKLQPHKLFFNI